MGYGYNFLHCDRDQPFLLPPDLRDWLPQGHLTWFILDVVDQVDLDTFYRAQRNVRAPCAGGYKNRSPGSRRLVGCSQRRYWRLISPARHWRSFS